MEDAALPAWELNMASAARVNALEDSVSSWTVGGCNEIPSYVEGYHALKSCDSVSVNIEYLK